jgi:hypothetical protein
METMLLFFECSSGPERGDLCHQHYANFVDDAASAIGRSGLSDS